MKLSFVEHPYCVKITHSYTDFKKFLRRIPLRKINQKSKKKKSEKGPGNKDEWEIFAGLCGLLFSPTVYTLKYRNLSVGERTCFSFPGEVC